MSPPKTIEDWCALPELVIPETKSPHETGLVVKVLKVGLLYAPRAQCERVGLKSVVELPDGPGGKPAAALPTATVETDTGPKLYRLPQALGDWAFSAVALAQQDQKMFPALTEFCNLNGKYVADIQ